MGIALSKENRLIKIINDRSLFRILYIISLMLCSVAFVEIIANVVRVLLFVWGIYLVYDSIFNRNILQDFVCAKPLLAFTLCSLLTSFIHIGAHLFENLILILHTLICFFVIFGLYTEEKEKLRNELNTVCIFFIYLVTALSAYSIILAIVVNKSLVMPSYPVPIIDNLFSFDAQLFGYTLIIYKNRFTGIFTNPNLLGFTCATAIVMCHMMMKRTSFGIKNERQIEPKKLKICLIVNVIALLLSDSNSSILFMVVYLSILVFYKLFSSQYNRNIRVIFRKTVVLLLTVAIITVCFFGTRFLLRKWFLLLTSVTSIGNTIPGVPEETPTYEHENTNLDSGRLVLLKQALSFIKKFPLFGVGKGNIIDMGYSFFENGLKFPDFHNGYITIIVCSGFIGFILFMIFAVVIGKSTISTLMSKKLNHGDDIFPCLASFVGAYCVYALFEKTMMFDITFMVIIFWYILGFCANYLDFSKMKFLKKLCIQCI